MKPSIARQFQRLKSIPKRRLYGVLGIALVITVATFWLAWRTPANTRPDLAPPVLPTVAVAQVDREDLFREVTIPAEFRPYQEVTLHAKVSGFVDQMHVDIGDRVKAGQLLATLEVPELRDDLAHATAMESKNDQDVQNAQATYDDAHTNYNRLAAVNEQHPNLVAQQDLDNAHAKALSASAALAAAREQVHIAKADVARLQTMLKYTRITAPFDGVVTRRYADPGALIQAGTASDTQSMPLVRVSDNYRLRLDFYVSVDTVKDIHQGDQVEVRVDSLGGRTFTGAVSRFTGKVEEDTRKMTTEIEVPNPTLALVPGMYATVFLKVEPRPQALVIPTEAVGAGKQPTVFVINRNHEIEERPITLGLETPAKYEVLAGLNEGDLVMIGNRSQVKPGQKVQPKMTASLAPP